MPRAGSPDAASQSPYIAYEAPVWDERIAVVSNGTHTRPIFERLKAGNAARDAILSVLIGLDREFDEYDTPRVCGVIDMAADALWLGSITATAVAVMPIKVTTGQMAYITTYNFPLPSRAQVDSAFTPIKAAEVCMHVVKGSILTGFSKPICSAAVVALGSGVDVETLNV